jgi:hypothetical protein
MGTDRFPLRVPSESVILYGITTVWPPIWLRFSVAEAVPLPMPVSEAGPVQVTVSPEGAGHDSVMLNVVLVVAASAALASPHIPISRRMFFIDLLQMALLD